MKQALKQLERDDVYLGHRSKTRADAITALRQAIEQAENAVLEEREACAKLVEADGLARGEYGYMLTKAATRIRARGAFVHASDMSQERVDETAKDRQEWAMQQMVDENQRLGLYVKEKNCPSAD